ncbi:MAG: hypothetical protein M3552_22700 [Planctomycetota bacterium]|nr:hypothetical protein [Planctomycetota bacterium]
MRCFTAFLCWTLFVVGPLSATEPFLPEAVEVPVKLVELNATDRETVLKEIFAAWAERRARLDRAHYVIEGEDLFPQGSLTFGDPLVRMPRPPGGILPITPAEDYTSQFRCERSFETFDHTKRTFRSNVRIGLRDGDRLVELIPRDRNPHTGAFDAQFDYDTHAGSMISGATPLLHAHGYIDDANGEKRGDFSAVPEAKDFDVLGRAYWNDCACIVLRSEILRNRLYRNLWIDLDRDAAVVRIVVLRDGEQLSEMVTTFADVDGTWMPSTWSHTLWESLGEVKQTWSRTLVSTNGDVDLKSVSFWAEPKPGDMMRRDRKLWCHEGPDKVPTEINDPQKKRPAAGGGGFGPGMGRRKIPTET